MLARFSAADPFEGETRAASAGEVISLYQAGKVDAARMLDLLHTMAPELSIDQRRRAAAKLAAISADGQWDENETFEGVFYLASLITGAEPNPAERIEAANELAILYQAGELDADSALDLMNTIAPGLGINNRRHAAAALETLASNGELDDAERMAAASEVFRLVTGVPLAAEQRIGAAADLAGIAAQTFGNGQFDNGLAQTAAAVISQAVSGNLTAESLQSLLEFSN